METREIQLISDTDLLRTKSPFSPEQLAEFYRATPANKIMRRPAKGGGTWDYVKTGYVIETLNRIFGYMWSFEVVTSLEEAAKIAASGTCIVKGRLTAKVGDMTLVKEQFGRCEVKFKTVFENGRKVRSKEFLDFGNNMKGAASDALKKCASEFGLFRDIYHKDDFEELVVVSEDEKKASEDAKVEEAKNELRKANDIIALQGVWVRLSPELRRNQSVVRSKDMLKRKFLKKAKEVNESPENSAE